MSAASSPARLRGLALIALAAVSWGTTGAVTTLLVSRAGTTPLVIAVALSRPRSPRIADVLRREAGRDTWRWLALGACMAVFQVTYFTAVTHAGIAVTALVAICSAPLMIAGLAPALLGERLTPRLIAALTLGVAGTALLVATPVSGATAPRPVSGVMLALGAGLAYALYVVIAKRAVARRSPMVVSALTFVIAAIMMLPALVTPDIAGQLALGWPGLLYLGAVTTAAAYALYTTGLRSVSATAAGVASLLEPLTATVLGVVLFGERFGVAGWVGAVLLVVGLVLVVAAERR